MKHARSLCLSLSLLALVLMVALAGSGCQSTPGEDGSGEFPLQVRAGVSGLGLAAEATGRDGHGIGAALSFYPVTPLFSKLGPESRAEARREGGGSL